MKSTCLGALLLILFSATRIPAQNKIEEIDKVIDYCAANAMFNGNILVAEKGKVIYHRAIGTADFQSARLLDTNTAFCLGSISKQFTAMGIMILVHQEKLAYTSTLGDLFPNLPSYLHPITIKNLLQHTSGLKRTHYQDHDSLVNEEIFQVLMNAKGETLMFEPGTNLSYSNTAYILLAMIIEKASGKKYEVFLREHVWQPLGMTHTFVMGKEDRGRKDVAIGWDGFGKKADFNVLTYGTNGVYSTTADLLKWSQSFLTDELLPREAKKEAYQPATSNAGKALDLTMSGNTWSYGFGQFIFRDTFEGVIGHSGAFGGFYNILMRDMKNNRDIIVLTNNGRLLPIFELGNALQNILREKPYSLPKVSIDLAIRRKYYSDTDASIRYYHELKRDSAHKYKFADQSELNRLGYALMVDNRLTDAIKIFKLLVSEFPDHVNTHDSLGEAYFNNGQYDLAIKSYQKALDMDPYYDDAAHAKEMIQKSKEKLASK